MDDNEDWLGCKRCGQFFHASCVGVNFVTALQDPFFLLSMITHLKTHK